MRTALDDYFLGRKVLITGGLGFIGSNLARRVVELGATPTLVDSLWPDFGGNPYNIDGIENAVRVNISDVRDPYSLRHLVQQCDVVFNLAGQTSHLDSMNDPFTDLDINCRAQLSILEACRHFNPDAKIVFASTRQIYGRPERLPVDESHPLRPVDVNGVNKIAGEFYHQLYSDVYGMRSCSLRLTNTYGPRMRIKDARQTFLGLWIAAVVDDRTFEVWGGEQKRDFTFVTDAVNAFLLAAADDQANGRVFNVGGNEVVSLTELAALLVDIAGSGRFDAKEFPAQRKRIDIGDYYADDRLIRSRLGWAPSVALAEGLRETVEFYRIHGSRYR
jgi:UDP-glucose 4-epimerase